VSDAQLQWIDRDGKPLGTLDERGNYGQIALSPDVNHPGFVGEPLL
jgi:hypothetical protein